jgi:hypothetical protein
LSRHALIFCFMQLKWNMPEEPGGEFELTYALEISPPPQDLRPTSSGQAQVGLREAYSAMPSTVLYVSQSHLNAYILGDVCSLLSPVHRSLRRCTEDRSVCSRSQNCFQARATRFEFGRSTALGVGRSVFAVRFPLRQLCLPSLTHLRLCPSLR